MKNFKKQFLWTFLEIEIYDKEINNYDLENIFKIIENFENKYSRFKKWNYLWNLNEKKEAEIDEDFKTIINISKKINELSKWYFDITLLPFLENIWYGIQNEEIIENFGMDNIYIENWKIFLKNNIQIEIWWVWKWYIVDVIFDILKKKYKNFIINFGWDIKIYWKEKFFLEDPINNKNIIWEIEIENLALASSWGSKRKTEKWHHLINPKKWKSENEKLGVYVTHKFASFADAFATALFVTPINISLEILNKIDWLEAMIIMSNGDRYKTKKFNFKNKRW